MGDPVGVRFVRINGHADINGREAHRAVRIGFLGSGSLRPYGAEGNLARHKRRPDAPAKTAQGRRDKQGRRVAAPIRFRDAGVIHDNILENRGPRVHGVDVPFLNE